MRRALDLGINYFDTAPVYHDSEALLAHALAGVPRDETVVATKYPSVVDVHADAPPLAPPSVIRPSVEASLRRLRRDAVDIVLIHALRPELYDECRERQVPELLRLKDDGLARFVGISGWPVMVGRAVADGWPDVVMPNYNLLTHAAERHVFPLASPARRGRGRDDAGASRHGGPRALARGGETDEGRRRGADLRQCRMRSRSTGSSTAMWSR